MHLNGPVTAVDDLRFDPISRDYRDRIVKMEAGQRLNFT
jgi:hypothetical protein